MENYKVLRAIGKGSFGKVYVVRHIGEKKHYVMKVIKMRGIPKAEREACKNEVEVMKRLPHPNIVAYKDSFAVQGGDKLCIVMTYCDGGDLSARLEQQRGKLLAEDQILHWFVQMALGLGCMHAGNILHRDLKTANIFLLTSGRLVLGDLGISKSLDATMAMASTQIGTPYYMSPELFQSKAYNHKSDVWALGCVLYEMCTLRHPFEAESIQQLGARILRGRFPPIATRFSRGLRSLIDSMLDLSPASRPSVEDVLRSPFMRKPLTSFVRDMAKRAAAASPGVGMGTMAFGSALHELAAPSPDVVSLGPHSASLFNQLRSMGLSSLAAKAVAPVLPAVAKPEAARSVNGAALALPGSRYGSKPPRHARGVSVGAAHAGVLEPPVPAAWRSLSAPDEPYVHHASGSGAKLSPYEAAGRENSRDDVADEVGLEEAPYDEKDEDVAAYDEDGEDEEVEEGEEEEAVVDAAVLEVGMDADLEAAAAEDEVELAAAAAELKAVFEASLQRCDKLHRSIQQLRRRALDGAEAQSKAAVATPPHGARGADAPPAGRGSADEAARAGVPRMSPGTEALLLAAPGGGSGGGEYGGYGYEGDDDAAEVGEAWGDDWAVEWGDGEAEEGDEALEADDAVEEPAGAESGYLGRRAAAVRAEVEHAVGSALLEEMLAVERRRLHDDSAEADAELARRTRALEARLGGPRVALLQRVRELVHVESVLAVA